MHQVLTETDLLNELLEAFQWQWNTTLIMLGFSLANPISPSTSMAQKAREKSIAVFEIIGSNNAAVSMNAACVTRGLLAKSDFLGSPFRHGIGS